MQMRARDVMRESNMCMTIIRINLRCSAIDYYTREPWPSWNFNVFEVKRNDCETEAIVICI